MDNALTTSLPISQFGTEFGLFCNAITGKAGDITGLPADNAKAAGKLSPALQSTPSHCI